MNTRREFLQHSGALVVSFALFGRAAAQEAGRSGSDGTLPGSLDKAPWLDAWIRIDADNRVTVFTGKCELGQGIKTALMQVAAEELDVELARVTIVTADTAKTPNEGFTAGSNSMKDSGTALRNAAAQAREILLERAASRLDAQVAALTVQDGTVATRDGRRVTYGELIEGQQLHVEVRPAARFKDPKAYRIVAKSIARVDIPAKVAGGIAYIHDLRLPGMLHARVLRPPGYGAVLESVDAATVEAIARGVKVVRDGNFLAVVAPREWTAVKALRAVAQRRTLARGRRFARYRPAAGGAVGHARAGRGRRGTPGQGCRREDLGSDLHASLPGPRVDGSLVRRGAAEGRHADGLVAHAGRVSRS